MNQVGAADQIGRIARLQQSDFKPVMANGIQCRSGQYVEQVVPQRDGPAHQPVDMPAAQSGGFQVVGTQHHPVRTVTQQGDQRVEFPALAALPDLDHHSGVDLLPGLRQRAGLVVGRDARADIPA